MLGFSNHRTPAVSSEPPCSPASHPELFYVESGGGTVHSLEVRTPPYPPPPSAHLTLFLQELRSWGQRRTAGKERAGLILRRWGSMGDLVLASRELCF